VGLKRPLLCAAVLAAVALGAFAATGFGLGGDSNTSVTTATVKTHAVKAPPAGAPAVGKRRASLFKITYRSTDPTSVPAGLNTVTVKSCPKGAGVLNGWFHRTGIAPGGVFALGGTPNGLRKWDLVFTNNNGTPVNVKFGIICIK
jgi:hypothetical protein